VRLVQLAADQVGIFIRFEVGQPDNDFLREKRGGQGTDPFDQLFNVELHRASVATDTLVNGLLNIPWQGVIVQQRLRVHTDHPVDDELKARQTNPLIRQ